MASESGFTYNVLPVNGVAGALELLDELDDEALDDTLLADDETDDDALD